LETTPLFLRTSHHTRRITETCPSSSCEPRHSSCRELPRRRPSTEPVAMRRCCVGGFGLAAAVRPQVESRESRSAAQTGTAPDSTNAQRHQISRRGSVAQWSGRWTCDCFNPDRCTVECDFGEIVHTHLSLSPSSIIWYQRRQLGGKQAHRATNWPRVHGLAASAGIQLRTWNCLPTDEASLNSFEHELKTPSCYYVPVLPTFCTAPSFLGPRSVLQSAQHYEGQINVKS